MDNELRTREERAYTESYSDGLVDLFAGLSIGWIGVAWLWVDSLAGLAGVFPVVLVPAFVVLRRRLVEPRAGYVKWSLRRTNWEKRQVLLLLWLGIGAFCLGIGVFLAARDGFDWGSLAAGLPAVLLGLPALMLGTTSGIRRLLGYGALLIISGLITVALEGDPGADLLFSGLVMAVVGSGLWARFVRSNQKHHA